jgi:hypothetical protein
VAVQQNGAVSPGHSAVWTTNGIIQDGGPFPAGPRVLGSSLGASFSTTTDQPILLPQTVSAFQLTGIIVTNASVSLTNAQGGFYTQPSKGGTALVQSSQIYVGLTSPSILIMPTLTATATSTRFSPAILATIGTQMAIFFSLTVAQVGNATADIYVLGVDLSP